MTNEAIEVLEKDIETQTEKLKLMKASLTTLKSEQKKKKFLRDSKLGSLYLRTVQTMSRPFAALNDRANLLLNNPEGVKYDELVQDAENLIKKAKKIENNEHKKAAKMAIACAEMVMEIEKFNEEYDHCHFSCLVADLDEQVQRLRPPVDEKKLEEFKEKLKEGMQAAMVANPEEVPCA